MIRALAPADAATYRELRARALREEPEAFSRAEPETVPELEARFAGPGITLGAFTEAGVLVGSVGFFREPGPKLQHKGWLVGMYVAPEARGRGVGRRLCEELIKRVRALPGLEQVLLAVGAENEPARALYRTVGFRPYGVEPRAVKVGGRYIDEEQMILDLRTPGSPASS